MLCLLALSLATSPAHATPYVMEAAGAGITVNLPKEWAEPTWSNWDMKAKTDGLILDLWYTPWQVEAAVGTVLQPIYLGHLKEQDARNPSVLPGIAGAGTA